MKITNRTHSELAANRSEAVRNAPYVVRAMNKNGVVSRARPSELDFCASREAAAKRRADLIEMNPGRQFVVCEE